VYVCVRACVCWPRFPLVFGIFSSSSSSSAPFFLRRTFARRHIRKNKTDEKYEAETWVGTRKVVYTCNRHDIEETNIYRE